MARDGPLSAAGVSRVPVQMWQPWAQSWCPSPSADVAAGSYATERLVHPRLVELARASVRESATPLVGVEYPTERPPPLPSPRPPAH
jgi:hypothetical protein